MGMIFDKIRGWEYALSVADFNRFIETGDLSLLPKGSTSPSKARKSRLIELSLMRPEKVSEMLDRILQISPVTVLKKPLKIEQLNQTVKILGHSTATVEP
jgi:hypothetical protein